MLWSAWDQWMNVFYMLFNISHDMDLKNICARDLRDYLVHICILSMTNNPNI